MGSAKTEVTRIAQRRLFADRCWGAGADIACEKALGGGLSESLANPRNPCWSYRSSGMPGDSDACKPIDRCDFQKHVLFATDFSDTADRAFAYLEQIVSHGVRKVTLLHVQDRQRIAGDLEAKLDEFNRIDRERLGLLESRLKEIASVEVAIECRYGFAKKEISKMADQSDASLVLMGTQGRGFFGEFFLGSVAADTARRSNVPTLLVPALR